MEEYSNPPYVDIDGSVEGKVRHLQDCLDSLRAEVNMKMQIMEQILNTRNEQFVVQKKLIEKEHALYENVLSHWRNGSEVTGIRHSSIPYSRNTHDLYVLPTAKSTGNSQVFKRTASPVASTTKDIKRKRLIAKRLRSTGPEPGSSSAGKTGSETLDQACDLEPGGVWDEDLDDDTNDTPDDSNEDPIDSEMELNSGGESDDAEIDPGSIGSGMEKKVFINYFSADPQNAEEGSSDPIWIHFLHEEKGSSALCKHCDEKGFQQIYKLRTPSMAMLRKHLKKKHKIIVEPPPLPVPDVDIPEQDKRDGRRRLMPFLRHNDHLYTRYTHRNFTEYWRCREKTCSGKLVKRPNSIQCTAEHNCLTTPADCDAILFRERIRELAETEPTLPPPEVIAAAKIGITEDVLELVPNDESLRRTIRRIRQALESAAPSTNDWMKLDEEASKYAEKLNI